MKKQIILTGDRPTGSFHLGHYVGSLAKRVEIQDKYKMYIEIADIQALTDNYDNPEKVRKSVFQLALEYLALGIDPKKVDIFIQSQIPQIAELTVFYSNLVTVSRLQRNPTVKEEIKQKNTLFKDGNVTFGFLGYPVSQAADITAFDAEIIPAGDDQIPQIEQTKEIVRKFNSIYGKTLIEPEVLLSDTCHRLQGLDGRKMGKSLGNAIFLDDKEDIVWKKIQSAITDTEKIKIDDKGNPNICNVYYYHQFFSKQFENIAQSCTKGDRGCVQCKKELFKNIMNLLTPIQDKKRYYEKRPDFVWEVLQKGTKNAYNTAEEVLQRVKTAMKLNYFT